MYQNFLVFIRKAWHAHALYWSNDETQQSAKRSCVVLSPHPDDETIGMGATIARKINSGSRVVLVVATDGRYSQESELITQEKLIEIRKNELNQAASILGISKSDIFFVDEIDTKINDSRLEEKFNEIIDSLDFVPEEIMSTSWFDGHQDHQACAKIAKKVAEERSIVFRACPIYWWAQGPSRSHREKHSVLNRQLGKILDLKRAFLERGIKVDAEEFSDKRKDALKCYESQISNISNEENWDTLDSDWLATFDRRSEFFIRQ